MATAAELTELTRGEFIQCLARWDVTAERMIVSLDYKGQSYIERMTPDEWRAYMDDLDNGPLRMGGLTLTFSGDREPDADAESGLRNYLREVDKSFVASRPNH